MGGGKGDTGEVRAEREGEKGGEVGWNGGVEDCGEDKGFGNYKGDWVCSGYGCSGSIRGEDHSPGGPRQGQLHGAKE